MKTCTRCKTTQPLDDFAYDSRRRDGRQSMCRACKKKYDKERAILRKRGKYYEQTFGFSFPAAYNHTQCSILMRLITAYHEDAQYPAECVDCVNAYRLVKDGLIQRNKARNTFEVTPLGAVTINRILASDDGYLTPSIRRAGQAMISGQRLPEAM